MLVLGDRAANAYAEDQMASQIQSSLALSGKPHVTIQGFPFLTQLAARNFKTVDVNASNETAGPGGQLEIASLTATLHGMHIHGTNSATVDQFTASALVTFTALAHAGGIPQGITLSADGPNQIKATVDILGFSSDATAKVTQVGSRQDQRQGHRLRRGAGRRPRQPGGLQHQHPEAPGRGDDPEHQHHPAGAPDHRGGQEHHPEPVTE